MDYKHFSHLHNLTIHRPYELGKQVVCSGCHFPCDNTKTAVHACHQCNFFLHDHCANAGRYVKHPSHKLHPLILLPYPTYAGSTFICNACGRPGKSFSYCCALCEFDLHVGCAMLPVSVVSEHHEHELGLYYGVQVMMLNINLDQILSIICMIVKVYGLKLCIIICRGLTVILLTTIFLFY